jgi:glutamine amidotransferase-like uncharacterized protein
MKFSVLLIVPAILLASTEAFAEAPAPAQVLLFNGTGSSPTEVTALESILVSMNLSYSTATTAQMNAITEAELKAYKLFLMPGGNSIQMGDYLTRAATALVHQGVMNDGVSYLGICAGAFMGGYSDIYNTFDLTGGVYFDFYKDYYRGVVDEILPVSFANASPLQIVWWSGPELSTFGNVVAKYPDGTTAIAEKALGSSFVLLSGVHPDAPLNWVYGFTVAEHTATVNYTKGMITAAMTKSLLQHF